ncbi:PACE efflux transporter [Shewanella eurypsychrophilus]|uniref:PACE efflux transporter n=1 Tax=Shewanella eurypsychrophilus TaxID=2593656 RepID=A0ABX6V3A3_9GAMM|nr:MULTISPECIES: PACE efflux transporter [Shewanella]QFU21827.1 PACE efflux transporter [Shewanella sp. YLB-09]QPG57117.1 PACE efflux transporter [Shewanella eurypsychrophilus]
MTTKQRIIHTILFEVFALILVVPLVIMITGKETGELFTVAVGLSFYAVIWNYFYNIWFDNRFGSNRSERSFLTRIGHALGFEGGIILVTLPVISWFMGISLFSAFLLELAFLVLFFFYAIGFNYVYDLVCEHMQTTSA